MIHPKRIILILLIIFCNHSFLVKSQVLLEANGPGNTYELINSVLAPNGGDVVENPECVHPEFGRHITEVWDATLKQYVFAFHIHVTPDNDRCINFDRQRMEIKTYESSPSNLKGTTGETVVYKWKFFVPVGFQQSSSFTHLHQIKAVGGDDADPLFVLTARKGNPNKLELNYYVDSDLNSQKLTSVDLSLFEGNWVEVTERIKIANSGGTYSILIKNIASGATILSYTNSNILTIRADNNFIRPKWGIYRSLNTPSDLRDEIVYFNSFSIQEEQNTEVNQVNYNQNKFAISNDSNSLFINCIYGKNAIVQIFNTNGQVIKNEQFKIANASGKYKVDISDLKSGVFILCLNTDNQKFTSNFVLTK